MSPADDGSVTDPCSSGRDPPITQLGLVGDRRTVAVISADGTVQWLCLPNFDGVPVFGNLLDARRGGFWRLGPERAIAGRQSYFDKNNVLVTRWDSADCELELIDAMLLPGGARAAADENRRTLLRRLCCRRGLAHCIMDLVPRADFGPGDAVSRVPGGLELRLAGQALGLWTSKPVEPGSDKVASDLQLAEGEEFWAVLGVAEQPAWWDVMAAERALKATIRHWEEWSGRYRYQGPRQDAVIHAGLAIELLSFAPTGALAAAATSSLPERIGGDRNYDYRYAWIRDASMAMATLSVLGDVESAERYLSWLAHLDSSTEMPLQVLYRVDGTTDVRQHSRKELAGYRGSRPVTFGNHAYRQRQIDCLGYLADCAVIYLDCGGRWQPEYWSMISRIAD
ncbi:MAG: hypothetical protein JO358_03535 [Alphaproteobacteria bacterium]|nr:hypothetical protein [Alphaproteobacteria bacterium]